MHLSSGKKNAANKALIENIILENYNQYYRLAYSYTKSEADAGDIVQNGAYKAIRGAHALKEPEYAKSWVYRIMLNECLQYLKRPEQVSYEKLQEENEAKTEYTEDYYADIDLQRALDALQDKDRVVIIMKYFEEKKLEEIAAILDENVSTVKSRLYRSIKKLRDILSDNTDAEQVKGKG